MSDRKMILHAGENKPAVIIVRRQPEPPPWHYRINPDGTVETFRVEVSR